MTMWSVRERTYSYAFVGATVKMYAGTTVGLLNATVTGGCRRSVRNNWETFVER